MKNLILLILTSLSVHPYTFAGGATNTTIQNLPCNTLLSTQGKTLEDLATINEQNIARTAQFDNAYNDWVDAVTKAGFIFESELSANNRFKLHRIEESSDFRLNTYSSPDGKWLALKRENQLLLLSLSTLEVHAASTANIMNQAVWSPTTPSDSLAYLKWFDVESLYIVDTNLNLKKYPLHPDNAVIKNLSYQYSHLEWDASGRYITVFGDAVSVIDTQSGKLVFYENRSNKNFKTSHIHTMAFNPTQPGEVIITRYNGQIELRQITESSISKAASFSFSNGMLPNAQRLRQWISLTSNFPFYLLPFSQDGQKFAVIRWLSEETSAVNSTNSTHKFELKIFDIKNKREISSHIDTLADVYQPRFDGFSLKWKEDDSFTLEGKFSSVEKRTGYVTVDPPGFESRPYGPIQFNSFAQPVTSQAPVPNSSTVSLLSTSQGRTVAYRYHNKALYILWETHSKKIVGSIFYPSDMEGFKRYKLDSNDVMINENNELVMRRYYENGGSNFYRIAPSEPTQELWDAMGLTHDQMVSN